MEVLLVVLVVQVVEVNVIQTTNSDPSRNCNRNSLSRSNNIKIMDLMETTNTDEGQAYLLNGVAE